MIKKSTSFLTCLLIAIALGAAGLNSVSLIKATLSTDTSCTDVGGTIDENGACVPLSTPTEPQCPKDWWYEPEMERCAPMPSTVLNNEGPVGSDNNDSSTQGGMPLPTFVKSIFFIK